MLFLLNSPPFIRYNKRYAYRIEGGLFMYKTQEARSLTHEIIDRYSCFLQENERSSATILKYIHGLNLVAAYFN